MRVKNQTPKRASRSRTHAVPAACESYADDMTLRYCQHDTTVAQAIAVLLIDCSQRHGVRGKRDERRSCKKQLQAAASGHLMPVNDSHACELHIKLLSISALLLRHQQRGMHQRENRRASACEPI